MTNYNPILFPILYYNTVVSIPGGQTTSLSVNVTDLTMTGMLMPATFTGTTITFNASVDDLNFFPLYNTAGTQLQTTVGTNRFVLFTPGDFSGIQYLQLVSGSVEAGNRLITLV